MCSSLRSMYVYYNIIIEFKNYRYKKYLDWINCIYLFIKNWHWMVKILSQLDNCLTHKYKNRNQQIFRQVTALLTH